MRKYFGSNSLVHYYAKIKFDSYDFLSSERKVDELLEKYNEIWDKVSKVIIKGFDNEHVYNEQYLKTKIKSYEGKFNTNFCDYKMPKNGSHCIYLSAVLTLCLKWVKTIILKFLKKNVNTLSKKKSD